MQRIKEHITSLLELAMIYIFSILVSRHTDKPERVSVVTEPGLTL